MIFQASSPGRNAFFDRITTNNQPISSQGLISAFTNDRNAVDQRIVLSDVVQGPHDKAASKKAACKHNLKGRCNKGDDC